MNVHEQVSSGTDSSQWITAIKATKLLSYMRNDSWLHSPATPLLYLNETKKIPLPHFNHSSESKRISESLREELKLYLQNIIELDKHHHRPGSKEKVSTVNCLCTLCVSRYKYPHILYKRD